MVIDPSKDMVTALGLGGVVLELSVGHSVQRPGCVRPAAIALAGIYEDVIVRTPQGWRFQSRVVTPPHLGHSFVFLIGIGMERRGS